MHKIRVYVDTSVFGGVHDEEFMEASKRFFSLLDSGKYRVLISEETAREIMDAPERVIAVYDGLADEIVERLLVSDEVVDLAQCYLDANVLGKASLSDALHVATATVYGADLILSWNFKHIVNFNRILGFNGVNIANGYRSMTILSPLEIGNDD